MLFSQQIRAARSLLGWDQQRLADQASVGVATVRRLEIKAGLLTGNAETVWKLQRALEEAGIVFINEDDSGGPGIRLRHRLND